MNKLPTFEMVIEENPESEVEVSFIALVDKPAIEKNFMAFKNLKLDFAIDPARQIISGPAMVPDTLIYRRDEGGEYNVFFSKDTIENIALKFFKKDYQKNINLFHDTTLSLQGVTIFESFISDKSRGVQPMQGFEDLPDGTWFISAKVENPNVWAKVQTGEIKGFSVEGIFSYRKKPVEIEISEVLNRTYNATGLIKQIDIMSLAKELVEKFKKTFFDGTPLVTPAPVVTPPPPPVSGQTLATDYKLKDGTAVSIDRLEIGGVALVNGVPAAAGEHELEDGTKITVGEGGVITLVTPAMSPTMAPALQMADVDAAIQKALAGYTASLEQHKQNLAKLVQDQKATIENQDKKITGLFEIMDELVKMPTADAVGDNQLSFSKQRSTSKEEKRASLVSYFQNLKSKTA